MPDVLQEQGEALAALIGRGFDPADITPERLMTEMVRRWVSNWSATTLTHYGPDDAQRYGVLSLATQLREDVPRFVKEALRPREAPKGEAPDA